MITRFLRIAAAAACVGIAAAACAVLASAPPTADVGPALRSELARRHVGADALTCPTSVPAVVGASVRCRFTVDDQPVDAVATIASVTGGSAAVTVRTEANPILRDLLAVKIARQLRAQAGWPVDAASCSGDLPPRTGARVTCSVTSGGRVEQVSVVVTGVVGGLVTFDVQR
jgi:Domain of unknown function (DUF4333)